MSKFPISIRPFGLQALLIEWPDQVDSGILDDILQFAEYIKTRMQPQQWELVPAYNSLTLIKRGTAINFAEYSEQLHEMYREKGSFPKKDKFLWRLPVCYDPEFGIDLEEIAERLQITVPELIALHTGNTYTVYGIGFLPGFMYLGGLNTSLEIPRRAAPRPRVAKGSVGIAGRQTGMYPQESPGGWNIIGNCSVPIFDATREHPCFVNVGDRIQFYAISRAAYELHKIEGEVGIYQVEKKKWDA